MARSSLRSQHCIYHPEVDEKYFRIKRISGRDDTQRCEYQRDFYFILNERTLDYIEDRRAKDPKRNVILKFNLILTTLQHSLRIGNYNAHKENGINFIIDAPNNPRRGDGNYNMLVPEHNNGQLLSYVRYPVKLEHTITSDDWIGDFQKPLGIGSFLVVEIPLLELPAVDESKLNAQQKVFKEKLDSAYEKLPSVEKELRAGDWKNVIRDSREVIELFNKGVTRYMKQLVAETTNISEEKAGDLTFGVDKLTSYTSDFHHPLENGKPKKVYTGEKEDAYLTYVVAASLTNLLARKFVKSLHGD